MAHISRSIDVAELVGTVTDRWNAFERTPANAMRPVVARIRWRAEVLTFEPKGDFTRVTIRIDYDPAGGDAGLSRGIEDSLRAFKSFVESPAPEAGWPTLASAGAGWKS